MTDEIKNLVESQRTFFASGKTLDVAFRRERLKALYRAISDNLALIHEALKKDLGKSESESYMCETGLVLSELSYMVRRIKKFSKPRRVRTPLAQSVS
ncbi:MAG: aldehyde dehydrogenase family protein, partial [Candidatus Gallimonas sp.]